MNITSMGMSITDSPINYMPGSKSKYKGETIEVKFYAKIRTGFLKSISIYGIGQSEEPIKKEQLIKKLEKIDIEAFIKKLDKSTFGYREEFTHRKKKTSILIKYLTDRRIREHVTFFGPMFLDWNHEFPGHIYFNGQNFR